MVWKGTDRGSGGALARGDVQAMMLFNVPMRISGGRGDAGEHVLDQLSAYIDYELVDAERERVREHLRRCPACENELATLNATKQLLTEGPLHLAPRSFVLTPEMVGRGVTTGPVERRRSFGWTLAGRLRTASALVAVLLVLVLSGDVLIRSGLLGSSSAAQLAPTFAASGAPQERPLQATATSAALAEPPTTTASSAAGAAEPPAAPLAADRPSTAATTAASPPDGTLAAPDTMTLATGAALTPAPPVANESNPDTLGASPPLAYDSQAPSGPVGTGAAAAPPVNGWQLAEGGLVILLLVLGLGALWARARGV